MSTRTRRSPRNSEVQSIPTVYAIFQGQLVADLTPARTEGQLTRYLDQILTQLPVRARRSSSRPRSSR
jgi:putative thioredoxin